MPVAKPVVAAVAAAVTKNLGWYVAGVATGHIG